MQSFRSELENPVVERDIIELERKIREFKQGKIPEEKFRSLRLARGVYGMRQEGVQMVRIKLPYGKLTAKKLSRIADVSDEYSAFWRLACHRSEEHTSELQSLRHLVCRLLLEKKKKHL